MGGLTNQATNQLTNQPLNHSITPLLPQRAALFSTYVWVIHTHFIPFFYRFVIKIIIRWQSVHQWGLSERGEGKFWCDWLNYIHSIFYILYFSRGAGWWLPTKSVRARIIQIGSGTLLLTLRWRWLAKILVDLVRSKNGIKTIKFVNYTVYTQ